MNVCRLMMRPRRRSGAASCSAAWQPATTITEIQPSTKSAAAARPNRPMVDMTTRPALLFGTGFLSCAEGERTADGADADRGHEEPEALRAESEDLAREERHVDREIEHGEADYQEDGEQYYDPARPQRIGEALADLLAERRADLARQRRAAGAHGQQHHGHDHERARVDEVRRGHAHARDEQAGRRRPHDRSEERRVGKECR